MDSRIEPPAPPLDPPYARDSDLVRRCIEGDEQAWKILIHRYQDLIYSIPRQYGLSPDDAADVYQAVCLSLWKGLPGLRSEKALTRWIQTACQRQTERMARKLKSDRKSGHREAALVVEDMPTILDKVIRAEEEHRLRIKLEQLPGRCASLLRLLYLVEPPRDYDEVARELDIPRGSIGPTRSRCFEKLRALLRK